MALLGERIAKIEVTTDHLKEKLGKMDVKLDGISESLGKHCGVLDDHARYWKWTFRILGLIGTLLLAWGSGIGESLIKKAFAAIGG